MKRLLIVGLLGLVSGCEAIRVVDYYLGLQRLEDRRERELEQDRRRREKAVTEYLREVHPAQDDPRPFLKKETSK